jgi:hypothetical protein
MTWRKVTPSITIYRGGQDSECSPHASRTDTGTGHRGKGNCPEEGATYPGAPDFADHLTCSLQNQDFDLAQSTSIPATAYRQGIPHAYGFSERHCGDQKLLAVIGAMNAAGLHFHLLDSVPCYRSEAGTGNAMGFAYRE